MYSVHYHVTPAGPAARLYRVNCLIQQPDPQGQVVSLPAWIPGSYLIRDFAKHIVAIRAAAGGSSLALQRLDKDSWRCAQCSGPLQLEYEVYASDPSVRAAQLDPDYGFFNGTSMFLRVHGQEQNACGMTLLRPPLPYGEAWRVATAMPAMHVDANGFGEYRAADYEELIDHPVAMGDFTLASFTAAGARHDVALFGRFEADLPRLCEDLAKICEQHIFFFDDHAPVDYYLFLVRVLGEGYGGLEHRASSALICSRDSLPHPRQASMSEGYREFLGLCSHEYFHTWNVKRIRPAAFAPPDLQNENYTELLWAFEGITSYYDDLALVRSGLISQESYLELLGQTITRVQRGKGRQRQTLAESSFYAWTKFYQQDENAPNAIVSYYTKGALAALCIDMAMRRHSANTRSLDDVMQTLWQRFGIEGDGVPEGAVEDIICEISGEELRPLLQQVLRSTDELPLAAMLALVGVTLQWRAAESPADKGGHNIGCGMMQTELGAGLQEQPGGVRVVNVLADGAAQRGGLLAGDVIIACNGLQANLARLQQVLQRAGTGDVLRLHAFRRDELRELRINLQAPEQTTCYLQIDAGADLQTQAVRGSWLTGKLSA